MKQTTDDDENVETTIQHLEAQLTELEKILNPYFQMSNEDLHKKLTPGELAKLDIYRSYCVNTLFYSMKSKERLFTTACSFISSPFFTVFLQTQGISTEEHQVKKELVLSTEKVVLFIFFLKKKQKM